MIRFYATPLSSYSAKVRIALIFKNVAFEELLPPGGYRSAEWKGMVPAGTVPAIWVDGVMLAESEAIIEYLEDTYPQPPLLPGNALARARARYLARLHDLYFEPRVRALFPLCKDPQRSRDDVNAAASALVTQIQLLEAFAQPAPYLAGPTFSTGDCGMVVSITLGQWLLAEMDVPLALPPGLAAWLATASAHPAVVTALVPWRSATAQWLQSLRSIKVPTP
jgi:glutathione S-transferase